VTSTNRISFQQRTDLIDWLVNSGYHWAGTQNEDAFLGRLFDLKKLPSTDSRKSQFPTAAEDIWQHRVNNSDWPDDWVFDDSRFNLRHGSDDTFLRFLEHTVSPRVRSNAAQSAAMVDAYNQIIRRSGWELVEDPDRRIGDTVHYRIAPTSGVHDPRTIEIAPPDLRVATVLTEQLRRLRRDLETDPPATIGHCKELLESQFKLILDSMNEPYSDRDDLPVLYGKLSRALGIHGEAVPGSSRASESIRTLLRSLATATKSISEIRNAIGTGHGRGSQSPAEKRHARLAFNATVAIAEFVADTWADEFSSVV
jgi:hypothetical protein